MSNGQRVLVVDDVSDTEEVLRAVLEPRGVHVDRVRSARLPASVPAAPPSVVVIDMEPTPASPDTPWGDVPQVIIGSARLPSETDDPHPSRRYIRKPFEYAELVQAIEKFIR